jgi:hypothetical protein
MTTMNKQHAFVRRACMLALAVAAPLALAKLPPPAAPATPEAKLKAQEAAARTAWTAKVDAWQLCKSQDKAAANARANAAAAGKPAAPVPALPACADPGAFAFAPPVEAKPIEAAGAHSPPQTASSPPSGTQPAAVTNPTPKQ